MRGSTAKFLRVLLRQSVLASLSVHLGRFSNASIAACVAAMLAGLRSRMSVLSAGAAPFARASPRRRIPSSPILLLVLRMSVLSAGAAPRARASPRWRSPSSPILLFQRLLQSELRDQVAVEQLVQRQVRDGRRQRAGNLKVERVVAPYGAGRGRPRALVVDLPRARLRLEERRRRRHGIEARHAAVGDVGADEAARHREQVAQRDVATVVCGVPPREDVGHACVEAQMALLHHVGDRERSREF